MALTPGAVRRERFQRSGWQFLMPPTSGRRLLCFDGLDGYTMLLLARTAGELTVIHDQPEVLREQQAMAQQAGASGITFALLGENGELPGVDGGFDGLVVHDPLGRILLAEGRRLAQVCAVAAARLKPGGFLYLGFRNRFGYSRLRSLRGPGPRLLSVRKALRAVRQHGLSAERPHPLLLDGPRVLEVVPESGYRSQHNRFVAGERVRRLVLRGFGARHLAPGYAVVAFHGVPTPSWLEAMLAEPWIQERCPGARVRRLLVLNLGKVVLSLAPSEEGRAPLIAVLAPEDFAAARRREESAVLQDLSRLPPHLAQTVPRFYGEHRFEEARVFLLGEFEGATVDRPHPDVPALARLAASWLISFHEATRRSTTIAEDTWPPLFGRLFQAASDNNPQLREELAQLEPEVRRAVLGRHLPSVWMHGDYKLENIVFAPDHSGLRGVIDWELSWREGLPLLDLLYLLLYNRVIQRGSGDVAEVVARVIEEGWTDAEQAVLAEYSEHFPGVAEMAPALLAMFFVHHVGVRIRYDLSRDITADYLRVIIRGLRFLLSKAPAPNPS